MKKTLYIIQPGVVDISRITVEVVRETNTAYIIQDGEETKTIVKSYYITENYDEVCDKLPHIADCVLADIEAEKIRIQKFIKELRERNENHG